jgi:hypothetical protein
MAWYDEMTWCDGCGVEITWGPVLTDRRTYCCRECSQDIPCACGERMELDEEQWSKGAASTFAITNYIV